MMIVRHTRQTLEALPLVHRSTPRADVPDPIVQFAITRGFDALTLFVRALPRWVAYALADAGGTITYRSWSTGRRNALTNFAQALGALPTSRHVRTTARRSFQYHVRMGADLLRQRQMNADQLRCHIRAEGVEHIATALQRGKGAILVAPHLGNFENGVGLGCFVEHHAIAVADEGFLANLMMGNRTRAGIDIVPRSKSLRPILRNLAKNDLVILVSDLAKDLKSVDVQFFGKPSPVPVGPAQLARKTGAALVPIYAIRDRDEKTLVRLEAPFAPIVTDNEEQDIRQMCQWMADFFARAIRENVEQWYPYQRYWADGAALR
jgi:phosphatidylinositol dimannoside acyltransferase